MAERIKILLAVTTFGAEGKLCFTRVLIPHREGEGIFANCAPATYLKAKQKKFTPQDWKKLET